MEENNKEIIEMSEKIEEAEQNILEEASAEHEHRHSQHSHHSHHHHHHHSSHRHRRKKSSSKKQTKFAKFMSKNKHKLWNAGIALVFVAALIVAGSFVDRSPYKNQKKETKKASVKDGYLNIEIPFFTEDVVIVGPAVEELTKSYPGVTATEIFQKAGGEERADIGLPVTISYSIDGVPEGYKIRSVKVFVSENSDFTSPMIITPKVKANSVKIPHLKTGTKYYFRISATISNGFVTSVEGNFKTAATPRILSVSGVGNLRDIGGYKTESGKTVKQGLLYRGCELDGAVKPTYAASEKGISDMLKILGIKTDMDLRLKSEVQGVADPLGAGVKHTIYEAPMYTDAFSDVGRAAIRNVFSDLAKKENYPVYMHCTHGMDRTGTVCYLLGAVLGVSEEDLMFDYQLSALYHGKIWSQDQMDLFINRLKMQQGATLREKAENYLLSAGVTPLEIQNLKEIYLA